MFESSIFPPSLRRPRILPAASGSLDPGTPVPAGGRALRRDARIPPEHDTRVLERFHFLFRESEHLPEYVPVIEPQRPAAPLQPGGGPAQHGGIALLDHVP